MSEFLGYARGLGIRKLASDLVGRTIVGHELKEMVQHKIGKPELLPPPLAPSTQADRLKKGFSADETLLRTGELKRSIAWGHTGSLTTVVGSFDKKAIYHELGTGHIPARSFLASTASEENTLLFAMYVKAFSMRFGGRSNIMPSASTIGLSMEVEALEGNAKPGG